MELRHLRYFVAVAEAENVSRAAVKLHVSQPALSRQIRDLEDELGFALLERSAKSVHLTDAGRAFLPEARAVLQRADEAVKAARAVATGKRSEIHVGYAPSPTVELLPCALHAFQNLAPEVRVTLHDLSTEEMLQGLVEGRLNLCLMVQPASRSMRGLKFEPLREYPTCVAFRPTHPFARLKRVAVNLLRDQPLVAFSRNAYPEYHSMIEELLGSIGATPRVVEEHDSVPGLIAAVEVGRGVAVVSSSLAMLTGQRIKLKPLHPAPPPLRVGATYDPRRLNGPASQFLDAARQAGFARLPKR